jgi:hypothetical protein
MAVRSFNARSFLVRWGIALALVLGTFNPTRYSFYHWVGDVEAGNLPLKVLVGIVLAILYVIFMRATWRSIGPFGLALAVAFFGAVIWLLIHWGLLDPEQRTIMTYVVLVVLATVLAVGISWSHIRRRVAGQADMDDVGD